MAADSIHAGTVRIIVSLWAGRRAARPSSGAVTGGC